MRLCLPSGLAAGVGIGVVEADVCLVRGSGLGVRAVSALSRAARAKASGEAGSEKKRRLITIGPSLWCFHLSIAVGELIQVMGVLLMGCPVL